MLMSINDTSNPLYGIPRRLTPCGAEDGSFVIEATYTGEKGTFDIATTVLGKDKDTDEVYHLSIFTEHNLITMVSLSRGVLKQKLCTDSLCGVSSTDQRTTLHHQRENRSSASTEGYLFMGLPSLLPHRLQSTASVETPTG